MNSIEHGQTMNETTRRRKRRRTIQIVSDVCTIFLGIIILADMVMNKTYHNANIVILACVIFNLALDLRFKYMYMKDHDI